MIVVTYQRGNSIDMSQHGCQSVTKDRLDSPLVVMVCHRWFEYGI